MLKLTFLGTSAGMPTKYRNVSGQAIECISVNNSTKKNSTRKNNGKKAKNRPWFLVDCGEGTQHQLLKTKLSPNALQAIFITHVHGDHCYGLAGLLASMAMSGRTASLTIVAPKAISKLLDTFTITTELYFPFAIEFIASEDILSSAYDEGNSTPLTFKFSDSHSVTVELVALSHRVPSVGYVFTQTIEQTLLDSDKLSQQNIEAGKIWGRLKHGCDAELEDGTILKSADYLYDTVDTIKVIIAGDNDRPELLSHAARDAVLLVHEATYTHDIAEKVRNKEDGHDPMHSSAKQVAEFAESIQLPHMILSHFSARYQLFDDCSAKLSNMGHIREEVEVYYKGRLNSQFWLAEDFDEYEITAHKVNLTKHRKKT